MRTIFAAMAALLLAAAPAAAAEDWRKLLDPASLAEMQSEGATLLDIRSPREYATAHIPGAVNAPYGAWRGPAENPGEPLDDARLTALLQVLGITPESRVVVAHAGVDRTDFGAAARVYWTLKSAGLDRIAILNGGTRGWVAAGRPLSVEPTVPEPSKARFSLSEDWTADSGEIARAVSGDRAATLVDARPEDFHAGEAKHPAAEKAGTIPGSRNLLHETWFGEEPTEIGPAERVAALAQEAGIGGEGEVVSFCNTGHWAATNWFALSELAGIEDVKLYPESMVGWTREGRPVEAPAD
jgi:thiosulfate/3-mercaptopyruvate sulfurtransferase